MTSDYLFASRQPAESHQFQKPHLSKPAVIFPRHVIPGFGLIRFWLVSSWRGEGGFFVTRLVGSQGGGPCGVSSCEDNSWDELRRPGDRSYETWLEGLGTPIGKNP